MYLITKHTTRLNGVHTDIPIGICSDIETAKKCVQKLNESLKHSEELALEQFIYREIEVLR